MGSPLLNLAVFAVLAVLAGLVFWPNRGLVPRLRQVRRLQPRIRLEDALKHIYHHESRGETPTLASVGGALEIAAGEAVELVERMQQSGLAVFRDGRVMLTSDGNRYALQVIRAHRLWERYLADETGVDALDWHAEAERREHLISPSEADELAERLGHPRFDPHGDPIPTASGEVPEHRMVPLTELEVGERAAVVHIEDEPQVVYAQLLEADIHLGMELDVEAKDDRRIVVRAGSRRRILAPIVASNVSIRRLAAGPETRQTTTLADLQPGEEATVVHLSPACRGAERRRLMDLGIVPGTTIEFERPGMTGGLTAFRVRGTVIALREEQTRMIAVDTSPAGASSGGSERNAS